MNGSHVLDLGQETPLRNSLRAVIGWVLLSLCRSRLWHFFKTRCDWLLLCRSRSRPLTQLWPCCDWLSSNSWSQTKTWSMCSRDPVVLRYHGGRGEHQIVFTKTIWLVKETMRLAVIDSINIERILFFSWHLVWTAESSFEFNRNPTWNDWLSHPKNDFRRVGDCVLSIELGRFSWFSLFRCN
jgi:hypothetical protein